MILADEQKVTKDSKGPEEATNDDLESVNDAVSDDELKGDGTLLMLAVSLYLWLKSTAIQNNRMTGFMGVKSTLLCLKKNCLFPFQQTNKFG